MNKSYPSVSTHDKLKVCRLFSALVAADTLRLNRPPIQRSSSSRIINGVEAINGEFPHQVSLLNNNYHMCGGSVIAKEWVLTASHCVDGLTASSLAIIVDLHDFNNPGNYLWFDVAEIVMVCQ